MKYLYFKYLSEWLIIFNHLFRVELMHLPSLRIYKFLVKFIFCTMLKIYFKSTHPFLSIY